MSFASPNRSHHALATDRSKPTGRLKKLWIYAILLALLCVGTATAQTGDRVGINKNFVDPPTAEKRQIQHNNFFLYADSEEAHSHSDDDTSIGTILDLQTHDYATRQRPAGLTYDVYSGIGFGLATSMMVVGPRLDADGYRRVVIIDTLEDYGAGQEMASLYLDLYNQKYLDRTGGPSLAPKDKLPLDTVIYTHNHIDHTGGVLGYLDAADKEACPAQDPNIRGLGGDYLARRNCVEIISQEKVVDAVVNTSSMSGRMIQARSAYMYGLTLKNELSPAPPILAEPYGQAITNGIGPYLSRGTAGFRIPSRTFAEEMWLTAAGVRMRIIYVPSETNDELAVFVPDALNGADAEALPSAESGLLFSAEVIQGPAFPNLYSLRGTQYRSPANWYASVDKLREFDSWCMVPSHGPPVCGRDNIQLLLRNFRDAVQFTHDQTLRYLNKGYTPDELVGLVKVPDEVTRELGEKLVPWPNATPDSRGLVHPEDYLLPFYGSVPQSVRETYFGYLGWYDGDPVHLSPTPPQEAAVRMASLISSGKSLADATRDALDAGEYQWAAELATISIRADRNDLNARKLKSQAFRELGARALNPNWSDWFFTSAAELYTENMDPKECFQPFLPVGLVSPVTQAAVPLEAWVNSWTWKVKGEQSKNETGDAVFGFWFEPTTQDFGVTGYLLRLRHGIVEVTQWQGTQADFLAETQSAVGMSEAALDQLIFDRAQCVTARNTQQKTGACETFVEAMKSDGIQLMKGNWSTVESFFSNFDDLPTCAAPVTVPRH